MQAPKRADTSAEIPSFRAPYAPADETLAARLLAAADRPTEAEARIDARATRLVEAIRARSGGLGGVEDFLHAYALSTKEGLALMVPSSFAAELNPWPSMCAPTMYISCGRVVPIFVQ